MLIHVCSHELEHLAKNGIRIHDIVILHIPNNLNEHSQPYPTYEVINSAQQYFSVEKLVTKHQVDLK